MILRNDRRLLFSVVAACFLFSLSACSWHGLDTSSPRRTLGTAPLASRRPETSAHRYLSHIVLLAHDDLKGRGTGSDGIDLAAGYIAGQFAAAGLEPGGPNGTYFQEFTIEGPAELLDETTLTIDTSMPGGGEIEAVLRTDFVPFGFSAQGEFDGDVVFVGYGITFQDEDYDDYAGLDVTDRVVLMLRREPPDLDPYGYSTHARFDRKVKLAAEKGATAVLIVNQDPGEDGIDGLMRFKAHEDHGIPAIHIKRRLADRLLAAGGLRSLTGLQRQLDETGKNASAPLASVYVSGNVAYESNDLIARNVIGILPGTGPNADEYVVIGAHYDHVGIRRGLIYNGADDNASGTAGVIELAWILTDVPDRDRSVICMTFSGEEMGLYGSKHFVKEPTVEIDSIVAMLNLDMIGRHNEEDEANMLAIQGLGTGGCFKEIAARRAEEAGINYIPDDSARAPSDHASFYHAGIPSLFFFTGVHEDLHRPTDDTEKINAEDAARIVDLVSNIALDLINAKDAPVFAKVHRRAKLFRHGGPRGQRVVMGIMPDMEDESTAPGWRVAAVFPNSGAAKAGIQRGDRVLRVEGNPITGFDDYRAAVRGKRPGDVIEVTVLRGREELTFSVELAAPD